MAESDPYLVLGIEAGASDQEVRAAFRRAVRAEHPDTSREDGTGVRRVIDAYRLLADPEARVRYDAARASQGRRVDLAPQPRSAPGRSTLCPKCQGSGVVRTTNVCPLCEGHPEITALDSSRAQVWRCRHCRGHGWVVLRIRCGTCRGSGAFRTG